MSAVDCTADQAADTIRWDVLASVQGANDTLVAAASAMGAPGAGVVQSLLGWEWIGRAGIVVAFVAGLLWRGGQMRSAEPA